MFWIKKFLGGILLLAGIAILFWTAYQFFSPSPEYPRSFRSLTWFIGSLASIYLGWRWLKDSGKSIMQVMDSDFHESPEFHQSIKNAQSSLNQIIAAIQHGQLPCYIKFPLHSPHGYCEHIWGLVHSYEDGYFNVSLAQPPVDTDHRMDEQRKIAESEVEDWQIIQLNGKIVGQYCVVAMFEYAERKGMYMTPRMKFEKSIFVNASI